MGGIIYFFKYLIIIIKTQSLEFHSTLFLSSYFTIIIIIIIKINNNYCYRQLYLLPY
jgi:hypothetical protein